LEVQDLAIKMPALIAKSECSTGKSGTKSIKKWL